MQRRSLTAALAQPWMCTVFPQLDQIEATLDGEQGGPFRTHRFHAPTCELRVAASPRNECSSPSAQAIDALDAQSSADLLRLEAAPALTNSGHVYPNATVVACAPSK